MMWPEKMASWDMSGEAVCSEASIILLFGSYSGLSLHLLLPPLNLKKK